MPQTVKRVLFLFLLPLILLETVGAQLPARVGWLLRGTVVCLRNGFHLWFSAPVEGGEFQLERRERDSKVRHSCDKVIDRVTIETDIYFVQEEEDLLTWVIASPWLADLAVENYHKFEWIRFPIFQSNKVIWNSLPMDLRSYAILPCTQIRRERERERENCETWAFDAKKGLHL